MDGSSKRKSGRRNSTRASPKVGRLDPSEDPAVQMAERVTYDQAARMLCVSPGHLGTLISTGELAVIQPARGRRIGLIEVSALEDLMDRWRARAQRTATARAKSCAGKKGRGRS